MLEEAATNAMIFKDLNSLWKIHAAATHSRQATDGFKEQVENLIAQLSLKK